MPLDGRRRRAHYPFIMKTPETNPDYSLRINPMDELPEDIKEPVKAAEERGIHVRKYLMRELTDDAKQGIFHTPEEVKELLEEIEMGLSGQDHESLGDHLDGRLSGGSIEELAEGAAGIPGADSHDPDVDSCEGKPVIRSLREIPFL